MPRRRSQVLTDHELRLMDVLWRSGQGTVAGVVAGLDDPPLAYTTVLTTLKTLEQKGYIDHAEEGRAYVYRPRVGRRDAAKSALHHVLDRFFGNSPGALALTLLDDTRLTRDELARIESALSHRRGDAT